MAQNDKNLFLSHFISQEPYIIWLSFMVHLCKMMMSPGVFFSVFQKFLFSGLLGGKKAKNSPKLQKGCLSHSISQEPYIIWLPFVVYECKMMISPGVFSHFYKILIFWFVSWVKGQIMTNNDKKLFLLCSISQEPNIIWSSFVVHKCKMIIQSNLFRRPPL